MLRLIVLSATLLHFACCLTAQVASGLSSPVLVKTDSLGNIEWTLSATADLSYYLPEIRLTADGGLILLSCSTLIIPDTWSDQFHIFYRAENQPVFASAISLPGFSAVVEKSIFQLGLLGYEANVILLPVSKGQVRNSDLPSTEKQ